LCDYWSYRSHTGKQKSNFNPSESEPANNLSSLFCHWHIAESPPGLLTAIRTYLQGYFVQLRTNNRQVAPTMHTCSGLIGLPPHWPITCLNFYWRVQQTSNLAPRPSIATIMLKFTSNGFEGNDVIEWWSSSSASIVSMWAWEPVMSRWHCLACNFHSDFFPKLWDNIWDRKPGYGANKPRCTSL